MEALRACLKTLPEKSSRLLRLRYFEGNSCGEVAKKLGTELSAVYKRLSRLHNRVREVGKRTACLNNLKQLQMC